jgi:hypothetical protein
VADKDKLSLEPVLFSLSIIPRALWNHPFAWRPLGFIPKLPSSTSLGFNAIMYAFVIDNIGCPKSSLFVLTPRSEWAKEFL